MAIKLFFLSILFFGSNVVYSQNWVFRVKPNLNFAQLGFYNSNIKQKDDVFEITSSTAFGKSRFPLLPTFDLNIELYELNRRTFFGIGIGSSYAALQSEYSYYAQNYNFVKPDGTYPLFDGSSFSSSGYLNNYISLFVKRKLPIVFNGKRENVNSFVLGFNIVNLNEVTKTESDFNFGNEWFLINENLKDYPKGVGKKNNINFSLLFRYEIEINSLKNNKNLFNLNFSYHQGFFKSYYHDLEATLFELNNPVASKLIMTSYSRGSNISLGIGKTFDFKRINRSK